MTWSLRFRTPDHERGWKPNAFRQISKPAISIGTKPSGNVILWFGAVSSYEQIKPPITPGSLLAFKFSEASVRMPSANGMAQGVRAECAQVTSGR
jgi:hypothetical protein